MSCDFYICRYYSISTYLDLYGPGKDMREFNSPNLVEYSQRISSSVVYMKSLPGTKQCFLKVMISPAIFMSYMNLLEPMTGFRIPFCSLGSKGWSLTLHWALGWPKDDWMPGLGFTPQTMPPGGWMGFPEGTRWKCLEVWCWKNRDLHWFYISTYMYIYIYMFYEVWCLDLMIFCKCFSHW